ncbi:MAG: hypothetical protein ABI867_24030 [Kofleriaceae bacterium]
MGNVSIVVCLVASAEAAAYADTIEDPEFVHGPPGDVMPRTDTTTIPGVRPPIAQDHGLWGGGIRVTGLSGIGALPGVSLGREFAVLVRHDEWFGELGLGRWEPQDTYIVTETPDRVKLGLDVWSLRGGWASRTMPLRGWMLVEVGEIAGQHGMSNAIARMVTMGVPDSRRWAAIGGGFGVAWPMSEHTRLFGSIEFAVPVDRTPLMTTTGTFEPDPATARSAIGLEVGWR